MCYDLPNSHYNILYVKLIGTEKIITSDLSKQSVCYITPKKFKCKLVCMLFNSNFLESP